MLPPPDKRAFSLVELSIVLVILGLLVGGVLSGQALIKAAQLRSVTQEHAKYVAALNSFRDKYFGKPGDITNATSLWGAAASPSSCGVGPTVPLTGTTTCNGNGDGWIWGNQSPPDEREELRAWQQMANAGLIEGQYLLVDMLNPLAYPRSKYNNSLWGFAHWGPLAANANPTLFGGDYGDSLIIDDSTQSMATFSGRDAWTIDKKIDDGIPGTGAVVSYKDCTSNTGMMSDANATYTLTTDTANCPLVFRRVI